MEGMPTETRPLRLVADPSPEEDGRGFTDATTIDHFLAVVGRYPTLSPQQQLELARRVAGGDERAREQLIQGSLRLVVAAATDPRALGTPLLEVIEEGAIGLIRAIDAFDPDQGTPFTPYATWRIGRTIQTASL